MLLDVVRSKINVIYTLTFVSVKSVVIVLRIKGKGKGKKVKFALEQTMKSHKWKRGIAPL
jgi:hypothetical protein